MKIPFKTLPAAALAAALSLAALPSQAATYQIDANSVDATVTDFSLTFDDLDGDTLFSLSELLTFSGFKGFDIDFKTLLAAAPVDGISKGDSYCCGGRAAWLVDPTQGIFSYAFLADSWTYEKLELPAPVPLPAAGLMLVGALGGLAALRRSRRASA